MMRLTIFLIILTLMLSVKSRGQNLLANTCDSTVLTKQEFAKCKGDTAYNEDIIARTNYITFIKTELLPKYRLKRKSILLQDHLLKDIRQLKTIYDSTLNAKLQKISLDMDKNQKYVQPKAYITSILSLETFRFYPDIFAVLLNPIHLNLNPKSDINRMGEFEKLAKKIYSSLNPQLKTEIGQITLALDKQRKDWNNSPFLDMFQGDINDDLRKEYNVLNFLLWTE